MREKGERKRAHFSSNFPGKSARNVDPDREKVAKPDIKVSPQTSLTLYALRSRFRPYSIFRQIFFLQIRLIFSPILVIFFSPLQLTGKSLVVFVEMQMEREIRNRNGIGIYSELSSDYDSNRVDQTDCNGRYPTSSASSSSSFPSAAVLPVSSPSLPSPPSPAVGYIEHPVSKLDTLAGVAIKYGVEVSD